MGEPDEGNLDEKQTDHMSALALSLDDAEVLAGFAVRHNIQGVQPAIEGIAAARDLYSDKNLKGDAQRKFYADYSALASGIAPVTVDSLKASMDEYGVPSKAFCFFGPEKKVSRATASARYHRNLALIALFWVIFVQSVWFVGTSLIHAMPTPTADEVDAIVRLTLSPGSSNQTEPEKLAAAKAEYVAVKLRRERVLVASQLAQWANSVSRFASWSSPNWKSWTMKMPKGGTPEQYDEWAAQVVASAQRICDVLQQFVLPLLYGFLGATCYALRTIAQKARDRVYTLEDAAGFHIRVWLGTIAGIAIGWFFQPEKATGAAVISPLALAFVAGYSVDLLFTAMDRVIQSFSGSTEDRDTSRVKPPPAMS
jgi:hypothetical protein